MINLIVSIFGFINIKIRIMVYEILDAMDLEKLNLVVNNYLKKGWRLQGGVQVIKVSPGAGLLDLRFYQAVVKEK